MEQSNYDLAIEVIGQAVFELLPPEDPENNESRQAVDNLLSAIEDSYILVKWPESQEYMEKDWFDKEAILETESKFGSSAYFIPLKRVL